MANERMEHAFVMDWNDRVVPTPSAMIDYARRALSIWPGLDRDRLRRAHNDPVRISRLVAGRTSMAMESILVLLRSDG